MTPEAWAARQASLRQYIYDVPIPAPESALSRWCARLRSATRFTLPKPWTMVDVPVVALEDLR